VRIPVKPLTGVLLFVATLSGQVACTDSGNQADPRSAGPDAEAIARNNRAVGHMGRFEYANAQGIFSQLAERYPEWLNIRVNLAIATLNRQNEGDEATALQIAQGVLEEDETHLSAHYVAGLMQLYLGNIDQAVNHFRAVVNADATDPHASYYLAQALAQQSQHTEALEWYRKAIDLDPYLRSAYYGAFQTLRHLKRKDEAQSLIASYQKLANNPRAHLAEFKYTRMGEKAEVQAFDVAQKKPRSIPTGPVFDVASTLPVGNKPVLSWQNPHASRPRSITAVDINNDDNLDLYLAGVLQGDKLHNLVLLNQPDNTFTAVTEHPLASVPDVNAAVWGDFDNDGLTDVYLCRRGANQLWQQTGSNAWSDVTETTRTANSDLDTVDCAFFDADHDGDLDLFLVNADGPDELLSNNLDGTFRPLAADYGLAGNDTPSRGVLPTDIDGDRDVDILVIHAQPPHEIFINDRLWSYHKATDFKIFSETPALAALAADRNADGYVELYTVRDDGQVLEWARDTNDEFVAWPIGKVVLEDADWAQLALIDANGNGTPDVMAAGPLGWNILSGTGVLASDDAVTPLAGVAPLLLDPKGGPSLLSLGEDGDLQLRAPGPGRAAYMSLSFTGKDDTAQSMRSNASGIGTYFSVRTGSQWTRRQNLRTHSGPGQGLQPIEAGLGGAERADFVAIDWSDGVFQSELNLPAGKVNRITETQRQLSSCPVLFAWNGEKYEFVSDLLGVGGIGYALAPGEYSTPRPRENFLLPNGLLKPHDGHYRLKIGEPMEEVAYLDAVRLAAYDLPPGWQMVLDERMGVFGPEPTGKPYFYRNEFLPRLVHNDRDENVTDTVTHSDTIAAPVGELDHRFIGRLRSEHVLTLEFDTPLDAHPGIPLLIADGWVEYPYSQTMFALWQAGASLHAPTLEAQDLDGHWHTLLPEFGYPAGMPRRMSVPLTNIPVGTRRLRLRTNMEVYWDRLAIGFAEALEEQHVHQLPLVHARFRKSGFAARSTHAQRRPYYDYDRREPFWDTRYMAGSYTRLGPVTELVARHDDAVAIIGAGEEVHIEFQAEQEPLPKGWTRRLVVETNGWAKDMDLFTKDGETVGPLPDSGKPPAARDALHAHYNTRYQAGK